MNITFECAGFSGSGQRSTGRVEIDVDGAVLCGFVDASEIIEEYTAETLLEEIGDDDIIKYLTEQGYAVIEP
ncbi:TPA: hypothetical protein RG680_000869 [Morganella morganii]|uniref:hypothetical protein n=1 Tax=Morganella morganii TaxID=582 RepID=UPI00280DA590|nr:hypothetical protein [Morganella morganii]